MKIKEDQMLAFIERRRRQVLIHSYLYYQMNTNLITDSQWDAWAYELAELQNLYPEIASKGVYAKDFKGFDGSSGFDLPTIDPWVIRKATYLLRISGGGTGRE